MSGNTGGYVNDPVTGGPGASILAPGVNCCAVAEARRAALLVDADSYFDTLASAFSRAERSIVIVGWDFDARIRLRPRDGPAGPSLGEFLHSLVARKPQLEIRILVWSLAPVHAPSAPLPLVLGEEWQDHERIHLRLDTHHPIYGAHHQKIVTVDDSLAFVGGMDLTVERWDTPEHAPGNDLRREPDNTPYDAVHDVQLVADGPLARVLGGIAATRWRDATGEALPRAPSVERWPSGLRPDFADIAAGVSRTAPAHAGRPQIEEIAKLNDDLLRSARRTIYIEAQYFTGRRLRRVLEEVLVRPDPPEIIVVSTRVANGLVERFIMGANRERLLRYLRAIDRNERLHAYFPVCDGTGEHRLLIHSKLMIIDDRYLRVGSANLNNRSVGLDTECDVTLEATTEEARKTVLHARDALLAEHLGTDVDAVRSAILREGSLSAAIDSLGHQARSLSPMEVGPGATRSFPGTALLDPERQFPVVARLRRAWQRG